MRIINDLNSLYNSLVFILFFHFLTAKNMRTIPVIANITSIMVVALNENKSFCPASLQDSHHSIASAAHKAEELEMSKGSNASVIIITSLVFIF